MWRQPLYPHISSFGNNKWWDNALDFVAVYDLMITIIVPGLPHGKASETAHSNTLGTIISFLLRHFSLLHSGLSQISTASPACSVKWRQKRKRHSVQHQSVPVHAVNTVWGILIVKAKERGNWLFGNTSCLLSDVIYITQQDRFRDLSLSQRRTEAHRGLLHFPVWKSESGHKSPQ